MTTVAINDLLATMHPDEIEDITRFVDSCLVAGWMKPDEAVEWKLSALAWAEFHRISPEMDSS